MVNQKPLTLTFLSAINNGAIHYNLLLVVCSKRSCNASCTM